MSDVQIVLRAANLAARWHAAQKRKGAAAEPYINHLLEVAGLVADATDGADAELVAAALLHDSIEDCEVPQTVLNDHFGSRVASLVIEMTDDKTLDKAVRKRKQIETASTKSHDAKILKMADKISNLRAVADSPSPDWSVTRRLDYIAWSKEVVTNLGLDHPTLTEQFERAVLKASQAATGL